MSEFGHMLEIILFWELRERMNATLTAILPEKNIQCLCSTLGERFYPKLVKGNGGLE